MKSILDKIITMKILLKSYMQCVTGANGNCLYMANQLSMSILLKNFTHM